MSRSEEGTEARPLSCEAHGRNKGTGSGGEPLPLVSSISDYSVDEEADRSWKSTGR